MAILYPVVSILYWGIFIAFMQANKGDTRYWEVYQYTDPSWKIEYVLLCIIGGFLWIVFIPVLAVYKIAFKFFKQKQTNK